MKKKVLGDGAGQKRTGAGQKRTGAGQKRTGSATLVLKHILVKFSLGRDSKLSMFNILGRLLVYNNTGTGTVQLHITGYFCIVIIKLFPLSLT